MKKTTLLLLSLALFSCEDPVKRVEPKHEGDNQELVKIYSEDQSDRQAGNLDWSVISKRDDERKSRVLELLDSNLVITSNDYANAAMIFQHGGDTTASGMAVRLMRKAVELDSTRNKWLLAAAIDRDLMRRGEPQIYGTQYTKQAQDDPWEIYNLDSTKISDEERKEFGVETLAEQKEWLKMMNKKKLDELLNSGISIDDLVEMIKTSDLENSEYDLSEGGINSFGYQLMAQEQNEAALKIFKLNTELYPEGYNTFDSYGECLVEMGQVEEGIAAYKKSLELNPDNDNAKEVLTELEK
ncbi:MAG: tetratricopeptide repeat protein [Bacteroidota bacterium]